MKEIKSCSCPRVRLVLLLLIAVGAFLFVCTPLAYPERYEMGRLLDLIPPDGSPEHYGNVVLRTAERDRKLPPAIFPHWLHRARYTCSVCHNELDFSLKWGETPITRESYLAGRYCGACHNGETAFTVKDQEPRFCERCHLMDKRALDVRFRKFSSDLPEANNGNKLDWVRALEEGLITTQKTFYDDGQFLPLPKNLQRPLTIKGASLTSETIFPHRQHAAWIDCSGCHPGIFNIKEKRNRPLFHGKEPVRLVLRHLPPASLLFHV